jgi:hypothetical protein
VGSPFRNNDIAESGPLLDQRALLDSGATKKAAVPQSLRGRGFHAPVTIYLTGCPVNHSAGHPQATTTRQATSSNDRDQDSCLLFDDLR